MSLKRLIWNNIKKKKLVDKDREFRSLPILMYLVIEDKPC
jgi:hypothetical protein